MSFIFFLKIPFEILIGNGISNQVQRELNVLSHHFDLSREMLKLNESLKSQSFFGSDDQNEGNEDPLESDGFVRVTPPLSPESRHSLLRNTVSQGIF